MSKRRDHEVPRSTLERFAGGQATETERQQVLRHLTRGCAYCRRALRLAGWHSEREELRLTLGNVVPAGPPAGIYDEAFEAAKRTAMSALNRRHASVKELLAELEAMPREEREFKVRNLRRYALGELALTLVDRSFEMRFSDTAALLHYAELAVAAADAAAPETAGGRSLLHDCRARAWAQLGNAKRIVGQLPQSEQCFARAVSNLEEGSGEAEPRAWVCFLKAALRTAQRAFSEAIALEEEAATLYHRLRDRAGEASALIGAAWARISSADPEPAIAPLQRALQILDPWHPWEEKLIRTASINLVLSYIDAGHPEDAYNTVALAEPYFEDCPDPIARQHWNWQRGNVDRDTGRLFASELRLSRVRDEFERENMVEKTAEISLDLAMVYARQGRRADFLRLMGETTMMFQALGTTREFLGALAQLAAAVPPREAAVAVLRQLAIQCRGGVPRAEPS